jgi:general secretion pathway protein F
MPRFYYTAIDSSGESRSGSYEAPSKEAVIKALRGMGLYPTEVYQEGEKRKGGLLAELFPTFFSREKRISRKGLMLFTRQLASLLRAGLPLDRALFILGDAAEDEAMKSLAHGILKDVEEGSSLSEALMRRQETFNRMYVHLVKAGEVGGALDTVLTNLADYLEESVQVRSQLVSASIYPIVLLMLGIVSSYLILTIVIPRFSLIFKDLGQEIPTSTKILLGVSAFFHKTWWVFLITPILVFVAWKAAMRREGLRIKWENMLFSTPILGNILKKLEVATIARALSILLKGGLDLSAAFRIVSEISGFITVNSILASLLEDIEKGQSLAQRMKANPFFPSFAVHIVEVGEETGDIGEAMTTIATTYEKELQEFMKRMLSFLEPALIIFMGLIIGGMIVSMLMAIFSINDIGF